MTLENSFYVPTIDVRPYLISPGSVAAERVINQVRQACISTGFFQIIGHGLDTTLQKQLFKAAENFFRLPLEEKKKLDSKQNFGYRGYDVLASQSYEVGVEPDLKEVSAYNFYNLLLGMPQCVGLMNKIPSKLSLLWTVYQRLFMTRQDQSLYF